ncbi:MAG TPA: hypothetical protein VG839_08190 [Asticcacaulis sp.]|nr:hypothetical protein [Asticcacaulis sp.]
MKNLNIVRLLLAGLVSGIIIYGFEAVTNAVILGHDWLLWSALATRLFVMPNEGLSLALWAGQALIAGWVGTFVFAAIKDWVGMRQRAAYMSGLIVWAPGWLGLSLDNLAVGVVPAKMVYDNLLAALLGCLIGQMVASLIYRDKGE